VTAALVALARDGLLLALALLAPVLVATVLAGVFTSLLGAVTQVRDPSVGFAPRLVAVVVALVITAPVIAGRLEAFTTRALTAIAVVGQGST
jgi:flagellar biosynthetic protein FliQ